MKEYDRIMIGDDMIFEEGWPRPRTNNKLRTYLQNVGGIYIGDDIYETQMIQQDLLQIQADIICLTETNLNMWNSEVRPNMIRIFKTQDRHTKVNICKQPET